MQIDIIMVYQVPKLIWACYSFNWTSLNSCYLLAVSY